MQAINIVPSVRGPSPLTYFVEQDPAFAQPTPAPLAFTEFYCQANGSNLNAGSDQNAAAKFTSTNGNWSTVTLTFIPTDGSNPVAAGVKVGDYASIYIDGATVGVFISRITAVVNAANGGITVLAASGSGGVGVAPVTSATTRTIKVGGACLGPNAATGFPLSLSRWGDQRDVSAHLVRANLKNDQTYSLTASFTIDSAGLASVVQGYSVTPGDGAILSGTTGKATFDGGTSTAQIISSTGVAGNVFRDLIFSTSFASGTASLIDIVVTVEFTRCVFKGARGMGIFTQGVAVITECEFSNCNTSNTSGFAGIRLQAAGCSVTRTTFHDFTGTNGNAINIVSGGNVIQNNIFARMVGHGVLINAGAIGNRISNNDFYKITGNAVHIITGLTLAIWIENNHFVMIAGAGINNLSTTLQGVAYNNSYGSCATGDTLGNIVDSGRMTIPAGTTPWVDPDNGNFAVSSTKSISTGRGAFLITQTYSGTTTGYPDVGAAARDDSYPLLDGVISGVTKDSVGNPLGTCVVHLFRTSDDLKLGSTVSDGSGVFSLPAPLNIACYLTAYLAGSPDVEGTSVNTLTGG